MRHAHERGRDRVAWKAGRSCAYDAAAMGCGIGSSVEASEAEQLLLIWAPCSLPDGKLEFRPGADAKSFLRNQGATFLQIARKCYIAESRLLSGYCTCMVGLPCLPLSLLPTVSDRCWSQRVRYELVWLPA